VRREVVWIVGFEGRRKYAGTERGRDARNDEWMNKRLSTFDRMQYRKEKREGFGRAEYLEACLRREREPPREGEKKRGRGSERKEERERERERELRIYVGKGR